MESRFDGFEPDNINGYINETGFDLTQADAIAYSRYLITQTDRLKLEYWSKKNTQELLSGTVTEFNWFLTKEAFVGEFHPLLSLLLQMKRLFFLLNMPLEFRKKNFQNTVCSEANTVPFSAVLKDRDLTNTTIFFCS